jgi:hypothetical protein
MWKCPGFHIVVHAISCDSQMKQRNSDLQTSQADVQTFRSIWSFEKCKRSMTTATSLYLSPTNVPSQNWQTTQDWVCDSHDDEPELAGFGIVAWLWHVGRLKLWPSHSEIMLSFREYRFQIWFKILFDGTFRFMFIRLFNCDSFQCCISRLIKLARGERDFINRIWTKWSWWEWFEVDSHPFIGWSGLWILLFRLRLPEVSDIWRWFEIAAISLVYIEWGADHEFLWVDGSLRFVIHWRYC